MDALALVIEDDVVARRRLVTALEHLDVEVREADSVEEARPILSDDFAVVFLDLGLPGISGGEFLLELQQSYPAVPVVIVTADRTVERAVEMMRKGAYDYMAKPIEAPELEALVHRAAGEWRLRHEVHRLRKELGRREGMDGIVGTSPAMRAVYEKIRKAAPSRISVTFLGESGTGKELLARSLHQESNRRHAPFVALNCAAVPRDLLESQLFGHRKGSFTGATDDQRGHFVLADGGTLFLDEIAEMNPELQSKLLRSLQESTVLPLGSEKEIKVDVRIVAATNRNLKELVADGTFREDLYYRIVAFPIEVPPLRERKEDIPELAFHFLQKHSGPAHEKMEHITLDAMQTLKAYDWPGNVRELENAIHQAMLMSSNPEAVDVDALPPEIRAAGRAAGATTAEDAGAAHEGHPRCGFHDPKTGELLPLRTIEDAAFQVALEEAGGNTTRAAKALGVARATFYRRLKSSEGS